MKNLLLSCSISFLILLAGCQQPSGTGSSSPASTPSDFKVIGYLPGRSVDTANIRFDQFTHINFAFAIPAKNGGGLDALRNSDKLQALVIWEISQDTRDETSLLKAINDVKNQN